MIGKTWQNKSTEEVYKFLDMEERGLNVRVITDKEALSTSVLDSPVFRDQYKEIIPEGQVARQVAPEQGSLQINTMPRDTMSRLKDVLMESIEKVREDRDYVPQATQIAKTAQTLVNLAKLEVDIRTKL